MKNTFKYMLMFACSLASVLSCARFDEQEDAPAAEPKVRMTFTAGIEGDTDTRTVLGGQMGDQYRKVLWEPGDSIGVANNLDYRNMDPFINTEKEVSEVATFEGEADYGDENYYMFYPYDKNLYCRDYDRIEFSLPSGQRYKDQSFDSGIMPMVAKGQRTERFQFQSLCGVLALNLTGSETIKSVSFSGRDASGNPIPVAGNFYVNMHYDAYPEIAPCVMLDNMNTSVGTVTLDCGEGIAIDPANPTPFYIVLPVGTYNEFSVVVATTDGKLMLKESKNPLTIKRANVTKTGALAYVADVAVDLSEIGHSNCYIVPKSGLYSFDADVIGNGDFGLVENANFHTRNTSIEPESAYIVWEDRSGVITGLAFDGKKISFMSAGTEGNALVAVRDTEENILWSWHIWVTDQPQEQVYVNDRGTFTMLDRNIGATRNDRGTGEEWRESSGTFYQWGRKDPFYRYGYSSPHTRLSIEESIALPTTVAAGSSPWTFQEDWDNNLWSVSQKTIYDPCPVGYKVPPMDVWYGFSKTGENVSRTTNMNVSGSFDYGFNFIYDGSNVSWYPATGRIGYWGENEEWNDRGRLWSAENNGWSSAYLNYYYVSVIETELHIKDNWEETHYGYSVRCMKDEGHVDISYPTVRLTSIKDITSSGATVVSNVTDEGVSAVTERGIVWGTSEEISLENAEHVVAADAGHGEYVIILEELAHSTRYYVRAYAISDKGTSYSDVKSFYTPYEGNAVNLSKDGTANCYIVPPVYSEYVFNASVKGNSEEAIGDIASVEVLWETRNTTHAINVGEVIDSGSVVLEGNNVHFKLPFDAKPGNALIAVKDALGTILWSWHIWVVDFDPIKNGQVYIGGNMMMDRNLGALSVIPSGNEVDFGAYGLLYQWGRKDPFTIPGRGDTAPEDAITAVSQNLSSIEETIVSPTVVYDDSYWGDDQTLWGSHKTKYDPCPVGWRVADETVWDGISSANMQNVNSTHRVIPEPYSVPQAYYPMSGRADGTQYLDYFNWYGWWWTSTRRRPFEIHYCDNIYLMELEVDFRVSVRCMKDADFSVKTGTATNIKGTSADVAGSVTVNDATVFEAVGFIYVDNMIADPTNSIRHSHDGVIDVNLGTKPGDFKTTLTGLKPNTTYKVRAYAKGGYNLRYGDEIFITTPSAGNGEGFDDGGDYEWE